jgi:hypothetical protein
MGLVLGFLITKIIGPSPEFKNISTNLYWPVVILVEIITSIASGFILRKHYILPASLLKITKVAVLTVFSLNIILVFIKGSITGNDILTIIINVIITGLWIYLPLRLANSYYSRHT